MHSDVSIYIAFAGEFFVRRLESRNEDPPELGGNNKSHPPDEISGGPPSESPPQDPAYYELIIDNDSGTYRPKAELLPKLKKFLEYNFPGLKIVTMDCKDAELLEKVKEEQRERKREEGHTIVFKQVHRDDSSISSSDDDALNNIPGKQEADEPDLFRTVKRDIASRGKSKRRHWKGLHRGRDALDQRIRHKMSASQSTAANSHLANGHGIAATAKTNER
jgi:hypothetical protein